MEDVDADVFGTSAASLQILLLVDVDAGASYLGGGVGWWMLMP